MPPSCSAFCKGSKCAFKQCFLISVKKECLVCFGRHLFLLSVFPYTGVYFGFGFLLEVTKLFCTSPSPKVSTTLILYCVNFYCFSSHQFHFCLPTLTLQPSIPIYTHFLFQPLEKRLERGRKREFQALSRHLPGPLPHRNPACREPSLPGGIRATRTGSASKRPGVERADWFRMNQSEGEAVHRPGRAQITERTQLKLKGQVCQGTGVSRALSHRPGHC